MAVFPFTFAVLGLLLVGAQQDPISRPAQAYEPAEGTDPVQIYAAARDAMRHREDAEASEILLWLWDHVLEREPAFYGVRAGSVVSSLTELAERYEPTRNALAERRDHLHKSIDAEPRTAPLELLRDWALLNQALGEQQRTLAWWDKVKDQTDDPQVSQRAAGMEIILKDLLLEELRWSELAKLYPNPKHFLERQIELRQHLLKAHSENEGLQSLPAELQASLKQRSLDRVRENFRKDTAVVYASLLAAKRDPEAAEIAKLAAKADELPAAMRLALVDMAIGAGVTREEHGRWIDEAEQHESLAAKARQLREWLRQGLQE